MSAQSKKSPRNDRKGFTLVELLVVISILGILSVIGISILTGTQKTARTAKRIADMKAIQASLDVYYFDNNSQYPKTTDLISGWRSECDIYAASWGKTSLGKLSPDDVIVDSVSGTKLVPKYMVSFPSDPKMNKANYTSCYMYRSDGDDYKLLDHAIGEISTADYMKYPTFVDTYRDGGSNVCILDGTAPWSWSISSPGGRCW